MKGFKDFLFSYSFALIILVGSLGYSIVSHAYFCEVPPGVCTGQPYGYRFGINCAAMPTQCGSCECDGSGNDMCDLYDPGGNPCPTPTSFPTPTPGPQPSFSFTPDGPAYLGERTINEYTSGFYIVIKNISSVTGNSCLAQVTNPDAFVLTGGTCGTIAPNGTCTVYLRGYPTYNAYFQNRICIRCTGMPICWVEAA